MSQKRKPYRPKDGNKGKGSYNPKTKKDKEEKGKEGFYPDAKGSNDLSWHSPDAELLKRSATLPWSYQTGECIYSIPYYKLASDPTYSARTSLPGFMVIRDQISCGGAGYLAPGVKDETYTLPTYNAANTLLTEMRARSRIRNTYDAPDVFVLMMAMANIYAAVFFAARAAATVRLFSYENHYMPEDLLRAQGLDPIWFKANQFRFVTELNVVISEINKVYVPKRMHLFKLLNERFSYYYSEGTNIKDQLYFFTPAFLNSIEYNPNANFASWLKPCMQFPGKWQGNVPPVTYYDASNLWTGDELLTGIRYMLNQVISHDSTPDITGDMQNCFGDGDRYILSQVNPSDLAVPVFNEEILEMIHNMTWSASVNAAFRAYDGSNAAPTFAVVQDAVDNRIGMYDLFSDVVANSPYYMSESAARLIDVHADPSPEKTFAITRLRNISGYKSADSTYVYINIMHSTDLICEVNLYAYDYSGGTKVLSTANFRMLYPANNVGDVIINANASSMHYRPFRYAIDSATLLPLPMMPTGECDIYSVVSDLETVRNMNRISLLTLLGAYNNA